MSRLCHRSDWIWFQFLRQHNISCLSLLQSLEFSKKFVWWWLLSKVILVLSLGLSKAEKLENCRAIGHWVLDFKITHCSPATKTNELSILNSICQDWNGKVLIVPILDLDKSLTNSKLPALHHFVILCLQCMLRCHSCFWCKLILKICRIFVAP